MAKKGLDTTFIHYGIRLDDMEIIKQLCVKHELDFDWIQDNLLKDFHEKKIRNQEIDEKSIEKLIDKALQKIK